MTFALDLQRFAEKVKARADEAVGGLVIAFANKIDERSPVGDAVYWKSPPPKGYVGGRFRGNWQLGISSMPGGVLNRVDPTGGRVRAEIQAVVPEDAAGKVYYLVNNVPYAQRLENGWSRQAPTGVVAITVSEFQTLVNDAVINAKAVHP